MTIPAQNRSPSLASDRQIAELEALRRMLVASRGTFSLSMAVCNSPALRDYLIQRIRADHNEIGTVTLPKDVPDPFDFTVRAAANNHPSALFLLALEDSLPSSQTDFPVLKRLNATRELWKQTFKCPVVFWLPEYAVTLLSVHARDVWSWRSHEFDFVPSEVGSHQSLQASYADSLALAASLDVDRKHFRIAELEQRIAAAGTPPPSELAHHVLTWLNELGLLFQTLGDLDKAETVQRQCLSLAEQRGDSAAVAAAFGNLGILSQTRGDLDQAEQFHRKSLAINEKLGRLEGMASEYANLGLIFQTRGDLDQAEQFHRKSLAIEEKLGHLEGMASDYGNLGLVFQERGDLDQAEQFHRKSLAINEKLGRLEGMANQYGNLGLIFQTRGDLAQAEQFLRQSLAINEKLGRLEGMANQYGNLGLIFQTRGDLAQAEQFLRQSLAINEKLGRLEGMANQYGNLGLIFRTRGDLDQAEQFHRKSLAINEKLGRLEGMANQYGNLGAVAEQRRDIPGARDLWTKSRDLYAQIGMPPMVQQLQSWLDSLPPDSSDSPKAT